MIIYNEREDFSLPDGYVLGWVKLEQKYPNKTYSFFVQAVVPKKFITESKKLPEATEV